MRSSGRILSDVRLAGMHVLMHRPEEEAAVVAAGAVVTFVAEKSNSATKLE